jgi:hypothetical protein
MRFKCAMGGYVFICMNGIVSGDMGSYGRKHLGTADTETVKAIIEQISNADIYFDRIVADKDTMKKITITERKQAELLGILYAEYELLTNEQISIVKQQMDKPSYDYNCEINSLWAFYNHVTYALKKSHPRDWMDDQRKFHWFVAFEFDLANFVEGAELVPVDQLELNYGQPENQLNILTEIEKAEENAELSQLAIERDNMQADIEADILDEDIRYAANYDAVFYEDPAGNTFEAPIVETQVERLSLDDILIRIPNAEKKALEETLEVEEVKPVEAEELIQLQEKLDKREIKVIAKNILEDDDFNFDLDFDDANKDDTLGGEFFL